jgi:ABC-type uncharacterized transport system substrate-binding protein
MRRREFIAALGSAAAWPLLASATEMRPRIVFLSLESKEDRGPLSAFTEALSGLGYVASQNIDIDYRYAAGDTKLLMPLAQELVALKPDVSIGGEPSSARALKSAAPTLPIVCPALTDALIPDLAASYARPGGTVTGIAQSVEGVTGKLLELAIEMIPKMRRIGFFFQPRRGIDAALCAEYRRRRAGPCPSPQESVLRVEKSAALRTAPPSSQGSRGSGK